MLFLAGMRRTADAMSLRHASLRALASLLVVASPYEQRAVLAAAFPWIEHICADLLDAGLEHEVRRGILLKAGY